MPIKIKNARLERDVSFRQSHKANCFQTVGAGSMQRYQEIIQQYRLWFITMFRRCLADGQRAGQWLCYAAVDSSVHVLCTHVSLARDDKIDVSYVQTPQISYDVHAAEWFNCGLGGVLVYKTKFRGGYCRCQCDIGAVSIDSQARIDLDKSCFFESVFRIVLFSSSSARSEVKRSNRLDHRILCQHALSKFEIHSFIYSPKKFQLAVD